MAKKKTISTPSDTRRHPPGEYDCHDITVKSNDINRVSAESLPWMKNGDRQALDSYTSNFLEFNREGFRFLDIEVSFSKGSAELIFFTSNKVGCIPLYSPVTGKTYATLQVKSRYNEDLGELLPLVEQSVDIEFLPHLQLPHSSAVRPPVYFECAKFVEKYIEAKRVNWQKFASEEKIQPYPTGSTQWAKYATTSFDPDKKLRFPNRHNFLTSEHREWKQLKYVLKLSIAELQAYTTPRSTYKAYEEKISQLQASESLQNVESTSSLRIVNTEPIQIRELKEIGNRILASESQEYRAWTLDFSKLYEGYVQYIVSLASKKVRAVSYNNTRYQVKGESTTWWLPFVEPDIVVRKEDMEIIIDAKYKSNMMNTKSENVEKIHEAFRHDLHQVMAYSSLGRNIDKCVMLVYPSRHIIVKHQEMRNHLTGVRNDIYLIGIPFGLCNDAENGSVMSIQKKVVMATNCFTELFNRHLSQIQ